MERWGRSFLYWNFVARSKVSLLSTKVMLGLFRLIIYPVRVNNGQGRPAWVVAMKNESLKKRDLEGEDEGNERINAMEEKIKV